MPERWHAEPLRCWVSTIEEAGKLVELRSEFAPVRFEVKDATSVFLRVGNVKVWINAATRLRVTWEPEVHESPTC